MNDHWKVLYQSHGFGADRKSKMAATVEHSLTLNPMGNTFEHCFFGNSFDGFGAVQNSKMAATVGHSLTLDPMGNMYKNFLLRN